MSDLVNFGCKLVRGSSTLKFKNICEGEPCPGLGTHSNSFCANGSCKFDNDVPRFRSVAQEKPISVSDSESVKVDKPKPTKKRRPVKGAGKLDITIVEAEFEDTDGVIGGATDSYVVLCIQNGTKRLAPSSPLAERDDCLCQTTKIEDNNDPYWGHNCESIDLNKSSHNTTILTFEAYDEDFLVADEFIGTNDISVFDVIKMGNNGKPFDIELFGPYSSKVTVNITWTSIR